MSYSDVRSRKAVLAAMAECRHLGREAFRSRYGFDASTTYALHYDGVEYDSKPILAVAHKYQFPAEGPLKNDFSGGKTHAARHLARLGFTVDGVTLGPNDWRLDEVKVIVAEYFDMMREGALGTLNKAERFRSLEKRLEGRNRSSLSRKCSNISAILEKLGLPWLPGLSPLPNIQVLLEAVVIDVVGEHPDLFDAEPPLGSAMSFAGDREVQPPEKAVLQQVQRSRRACRVDYAERDERNRRLGRAGERWAVGYLKQLLVECGRPDLSDRVEWVSQSQGDGLGYDVAAFEPDGSPIFVEVKTTNGKIGAPFVLSAGELAASEELGTSFRLMRLFDFSSDPRFYILEGNLRVTCHLVPQAYRAAPAS